MLPAGVLMIEHRLIERMIWLLSNELHSIKARGVPDSGFLEAAVDFMRSYADRCHHGKEEGILFRKLAEKPLSPEHQKVMNELVSEHEYARERVAKLDISRARFCNGDYSVITDIASCVKDIVDLYPCHIEKEDKHFFLPSMEYFTGDEKTEMLREFDEFDKSLFKDRYLKVVEAEESEKR